MSPQVRLKVRSSVITGSAFCGYRDYVCFCRWKAATKLLCLSPFVFRSKGFPFLLLILWYVDFQNLCRNELSVNYPVGFKRFGSVYDNDCKRLKVMFF